MKWFNQTFTAEQSTAIILSIVMLSIVACLVLLWVTDIYRLLPSWGPIRKFQQAGQEDLYERQALIQGHAARQEDAATLAARERLCYGAIGKPTWGSCESANVRETTFIHPEFGQCKVREGFAETQKMRAQSQWWAKDEPYFIAQRGLVPPPLLINEPIA
mmetsp:Transcript_126118/g.362782  ORF Transcript_126118/g.362782 Transcript_126118/m.362782 type:complete len:160 (-) Transcript_126118:98-577(-)